MNRYLAAYDVADDAQRARLARLLSRYGVRVQYSLFECLLGEETFGQLVEEAGRLLAPGSDRLGFFPQCEHCLAGRHLVGSDSLLERSYYVV